MICLFKVKEEKEDSPVVEDEEMLDDPDEDFDAISEEEEEETSEDEQLHGDDEGNEDPFNSLSQLADISLAAEGKLKDLALSEQIRNVMGEHFSRTLFKGASIYDVSTEGGGVKNATNLQTNSRIRGQRGEGVKKSQNSVDVIHMEAP